MAKDITFYGRPTSLDSLPDAMRQAWETANQLNTENPPPDGSSWVPLRSIWVDQSIQPRMRMDDAAIERYAEIVDELPPLPVQRTTFRLIGGRHRMAAAMKAGHDFVRVEERDVADDDMYAAAFEDNDKHGVPYSPTERVAYGRHLFAIHHPTKARKSMRWTFTQIARTAGIGERTVRMWAQREEDEAEGKIPKPAERSSITNAADDADRKAHAAEQADAARGNAPYASGDEAESPVTGDVDQSTTEPFPGRWWASLEPLLSAWPEDVAALLETSEQIGEQAVAVERVSTWLRDYEKSLLAHAQAIRAVEGAAVAPIELTREPEPDAEPAEVG